MSISDLPTILVPQPPQNISKRPRQDTYYENVSYHTSSDDIGLEIIFVQLFEDRSRY